MRRSLPAGAGLGMWLAVLAAGVWGGDEPPLRGHIFLPPTRGATELSTYIDAQARFVAAWGDYLESAAVARRHNAEALSRELDNAVKWVDTYFERREVNRARRLQENPLPLDKMASREKVKDRLIRELPGVVRQGDVTDELNWLLDKLATASVAVEVMKKSEAPDVPVELTLTPADVGHIVFTDGGRSNGQKLTFRADKAEVLAERWPMVLRSEPFEEARKEFSRLREQALTEVGQPDGLTYKTWREMQQAVDRLAGILAREYPPERRKSLPFQEYLVYRKGELFLQSLALQTYRLMSTNRVETFDGSDRFEGDNVVDLVRHACRRGLQFANPEPGDEPTYDKLLVAMRHLYVTLYP